MIDWDKRNRRTVQGSDRPGASAVLLIFVSMTFSGLSSMADEAGQSDVEEMQGQLEELMEETRKVDADGYPIENNRRFEGSPTATGPMKIMRDYGAHVMNQMVELNNDYLRSLRDAGWFEILYAKRLQNDDGLAESDAILARARVILERQKTRNDELADRILIEARELPIGDARARAEYLGGLESSISDNSPKREQIWAIETEVFDVVADLIEFLKKDRSAWVVQGEEILFHTDQDVEAFNAYLIRISELVAKQAQIQDSVIYK